MLKYSGLESTAVTDSSTGKEVYISTTARKTFRETYSDYAKVRNIVLNKFIADLFVGGQTGGRFSPKQGGGKGIIRQVGGGRFIGIVLDNQVKVIAVKGSVPRLPALPENYVHPEASAPSTMVSVPQTQVIQTSPPPSHTVSELPTPTQVPSAQTIAPPIPKLFPVGPTGVTSPTEVPGLRPDQGISYDTTKALPSLPQPQAPQIGQGITPSMQELPPDMKAMLSQPGVVTEQQKATWFERLKKFLGFGK